MSLQIKLIAGVLLALVFGLGFYTWSDRLVERGRNEVRAQWADASLAQLKQDTLERAKRQAAADHQTLLAQKVDRAHQETLSRLAADAAGARTELDRLRVAIRSHKPAAPGAGLSQACPSACQPDQASPTGELLEACAGRYSDLAAEADGLAEQLSSLLKVQELEADERANP